MILKVVFNDTDGHHICHDPSAINHALSLKIGRWSINDHRYSRFWKITTPSTTSLQCCHSGVPWHWKNCNFIFHFTVYLFLTTIYFIDIFLIHTFLFNHIVDKQAFVMPNKHHECSFPNWRKSYFPSWKALVNRNFSR